MLHFDWLKQHKKEIGMLAILCLVLLLCLALSSASRSKHLVKEGSHVVAIERQGAEESLSVPLLVEAEKDGKHQRVEVLLCLDGLSQDSSATEDKESQKAKGVRLEDAIEALVSEIEKQSRVDGDLHILLPSALEDGTRLSWKGQRNFRYLLVFLLLPICLLFIYETERQREKEQRLQYEAEIRKALPTYVDRLLLLLNCGVIFHDAFYRIEAGYAARKEQDAFSRLLSRIRKESDESGSMVVTVMKSLSQEVGLREYVRMVNILMDHQHRGVHLEEKLQAESHLLWEGRKAAAIQKGKEMETKMTFPLALLLIVLMIIAGTPALMNM